MQCVTVSIPPEAPKRSEITQPALTTEEMMTHFSNTPYKLIKDVLRVPGYIITFSYIRSKEGPSSRLTGEDPGIVGAYVNALLAKKADGATWLASNSHGNAAMDIYIIQDELIDQLRAMSL
jgi:hypothetical protein